ncbi:MAG: transcription antiterminator [Longicatena sp.]
MLNKRVIKIVDALLKQDSYITIDKISEVLQVSNKTIRNDLQLVGEWLEENQLSLIKKTGVGILIEGSKSAKLHVMEKINEKNNTMVDYSPQSRKIFIGMQLCSYDNCRIYELSQQLFVSRATIHKDILSLDDLLTTYTLQLHRKNNNGLILEGKERHIRSFLLELMLRDNGYQLFLDIIRNEHHACDGTLVFPGLEVSDDEIHDFMRCVLSSNNRYIESLTFQSLIPALLRMFVTYLRIQDKHYVHLSDDFLTELKGEPFYEETRALCDRLGNHYNIKCPEMEIRYLQVYFLALQSSDNFNIKEKEEAKQLTDRLLHTWSETLQLPFNKDDKLRTAIYTHMCPAIMRFRHGIPNENPLLPEILNLYANTFEITKKSMHFMEEHFHCTISKDEIGYLALHLAGSIERMKKPLNTILVAHSGNGAGNLLQEKISAHIPEVHIVSQESFFSIYEKKLDDIDLIITTIELNLKANIVCIQVNSLLRDYDIHHLQDAIKELYKLKNDPLNSKAALHT